jgi:hypothetical protein
MPLPTSASRQGYWSPGNTPALSSPIIGLMDFKLFRSAVMASLIPCFTPTLSARH